MGGVHPLIQKKVSLLNWLLFYRHNVLQCVLNNEIFYLVFVNQNRKFRVQS